MQQAAPDGIDAALDTVGTDEAIDVSLAVVFDPSRIATIVAFDRARHTRIKALGGNPDTAGRGAQEIRDAARLRLTALVTEGSLDIAMAPSFQLTDAAEAHRQLAAGRIHGRVVLVP